MPVEVATAQFIALPPPIIVLGAQSANTALIGAMLGRNSAAFAFPHLNLFVAGTLEALVTEMVQVLAQGQGPPFAGVHDVRLLARRAAIGSMLLRSPSVSRPNA